MADPLGEMKAIYDQAGIPFDDQTHASFRQAVEKNQRGKHGQLVYDLRGDFGLEPAKIRDRFSFYFERFPEIRAEID
jgi:hypothetical protein